MRRILFLPVLVGFAFAQGPTQPMPGLPGQPGAQPGPPQIPPAERPEIPAPKANIPLGENKVTQAISMSPCNGEDIAFLYRKFTGRRVIVTSAAANKEFSLYLDYNPAAPLTYAQAAEIIRRAAAIESFVFVADPTFPNLDYLTADARLPTLAYPVIHEGEKLPEVDEVVTYVMTFDHISPDTALQAFQGILTQTSGAYGSTTTTNSQLIITEHSTLIQGLLKIKDAIDVREDVVRTRFINVKYSDVTELANVLNELINNQQQAKTKAATARPANTPNPSVPPNPTAPQPANQMAAAVAGGSATNEAQPVQIVPEPRTNRIFAMGRPADLLFVEGLVREFDIESSTKTFLRRKLRFLTVSDFLPVAEEALNLAFAGEPGASGAAGATPGGGATGSRSGNRSSSNRNTASNRNSNGSGFSNFGQGNSSFGGNGMGGNNSFGGSSTGNSGLGLEAPDVTTAPEARRVGRTLLVADNITNSLVVNGPPSAIEIIERLLDQIDVKADQVMISTVIGQLNLDKNLQYGLDTLRLGHDLSFATGSLGILPFVNGTGGSRSFDAGDLSGSGLRLYGKIGSDMEYYVKALQSSNDFTVLARPSVFTANNQVGKISSGQAVAIPTNSNSYYQGGSNTQIQYQNVALTLEVVPLINSSDEITLNISLQSDEVTGTQTVEGAGPNGTNLTVPAITTRQMVTTVTVPNNETIVLGGLITSRKGEGVSGIPILSSIPVLGKLFSTTTKKDERAELLVFIQPSIVNSRRSLDNVQMGTDNRYKLAPPIRDFAEQSPDALPIPQGAPQETAPASARKAAPAAQRPAPEPEPSSIPKYRRPLRPLQAR